MGWWKVSSVENGGIDWGHNRGSGLGNATKGDHTENYYNGDGPADVMGFAMDAVESLGIPLTRQILEDAFFKQTGDGQIVRIFDAARQKIIHEYQGMWQRPPYEEELRAVFNFVVNYGYRK
jgi:hypothetical protein